MNLPLLITPSLHRSPVAVYSHQRCWVRLQHRVHSHKCRRSPTIAGAAESPSHNHLHATITDDRSLAHERCIRISDPPGWRCADRWSQQAALHLWHTRPQKASVWFAQFLQVLVGQAESDVVLFAAQGEKVPGQHQTVPERLLQTDLRNAHARTRIAAGTHVRDGERGGRLLRRGTEIQVRADQTRRRWWWRWW